MLGEQACDLDLERSWWSVVAILGFDRTTEAKKSPAEERSFLIVLATTVVLLATIVVSIDVVPVVVGVGVDDGVGVGNTNTTPSLRHVVVELLPLRRSK